MQTDQQATGSRVFERATGAQILPRPDEPHHGQRASVWSVWCCVSADQRAKHDVYCRLAAGMTIERSPDAG